MNRIRGARDERDVARPEQHPEEVHEPFLRAERHRRFPLRIEPDAVPLAVELTDRRAQIRQPAARAVAMVAREQGSLTELLHGDLRRGHVGIAEAEIDDVVARTPKLELQPLDLREGIRRKRVDAPELRHAANRCSAPSASRSATTSPITTSAGVGASSAAAPIAPSGATRTSSSSSVPREITAAGVEGGLPCAISRSASCPTTAPPMKAISVPGTAARPAASSCSTSLAANAVTACETPRCVTGMPAACGTAASEDTPGTISNGTCARTSASASSPPRPKTNGSPPLSRTTRRRRPCTTRSV